MDQPAAFRTNGETNLTRIKWLPPTAGWNSVNLNRSVAGGAAERWMATIIPRGSGRTRLPIIEYALPAGYTRFITRAGLDRSGVTPSTVGATVHFLVFTQDPRVPEVAAQVDLDWPKLGLSGRHQVRDLWLHQDLGRLKMLHATIPPHGSLLLKVELNQPHEMKPGKHCSQTAPPQNLFRSGIWLMLGLNLFVLPEAFSQSVRWICSTQSAPWVETNPPAPSAIRDDAPYDLVIRPDQPRQTIDGWGGCFNELGWQALQVLPPAQRDVVLKAIFDPQNGLNFTLCRMPIGASDYATNWYSLDETPGDFELKHFSLDRDRTILIPYIKAAMQFQPNLKIWGSPWSPPTWMKANHHYGAGGTNRFICQEKYLAAYARYFSKYVKAMRAEGIPVVAVAVQNEPFFGPGYPSCQMGARGNSGFYPRRPRTHVPARKDRCGNLAWHI